MTDETDMLNANIEVLRETEAQLVTERENADRLVAVLNTILASMHVDDRDDFRATLLSPLVSQLTLGHVIDGALALHQQVNAGRTPA